MYNIENFKVEKYTCNDKCFEMDIHIIMSSDSIVTKVDDAFTIIPPDVFVFTNLKNIQQLGRQDSALIGNT